MFDPSILHSFLTFKAVRSSGKGGQHVNKVSTSVELYFDVIRNPLLGHDQKSMILEKLKNRISSDGMLHLVSQTERSQVANKRKVTERFDQLIQQALKRKRTRIPTGVSAAQKQLRLESKKRHAEKKKQRRIKHDE
jgi:ribosome-associated protein